ncbi:hypothetical protein [Levilactobacillus yiduensis]|uniref:hypothetical protein n=1 Tax=Levilactobacillus yiduensis TaxID=2953880 RepID=UPI00215757C4|nr:hypothetical protein [Levilactobacillus yiduensis]
MEEKTIKTYWNLDPDSGVPLAQPTGEETKGWTVLYLLPETLESVQRYWKNYVYTAGVMKHTANWLPDLSIDHLIHENEVAQENIQQLKQTIAVLGGSQAQTTVDVQDVKEDVTEVKTATSALGGQVAQMMVAQTPATDAE